MRVADDDRVEASTAADDQRPPAPARRPAWAWLVGLGIVAALVLGVVAVLRSDDQPASPSAGQIASTVSSLVGAGVAAAANAPPASATAFQTIQPSMVYISAQHTGATSEDTSVGAGVVVNAQGQILTARHVVTGAQAINVTFADGTETTAQIASEQAATDIAVLTPAQLPSVVVPAVLGGGVRIGDDVFAVGHPLGLVDSLTSGVVSGLDRAVPIAGGTPLSGLIQFDAAVNPGNSGGPLLNRAGQVVGIVTALANPSDQTFFVGIGFAIPIATAGGAAGAPQQ
jgi:S1-C subfamily serine protease